MPLLAFNELGQPCDFWPDDKPPRDWMLEHAHYVTESPTFGVPFSAIEHAIDGQPIGYLQNKGTLKVLITSKGNAYFAYAIGENMLHLLCSATYWQDLCMLLEPDRYAKWQNTSRLLRLTYTPKLGYTMQIANSQSRKPSIHVSCKLSRLRSIANTVYGISEADFCQFAISALTKYPVSA